MSDIPLFVTCPRGVEPLLVQELATFGIADAREKPGGVAANAPLEAAYRACLWSRIASRVLLPLKTFPVSDPDTLYTAACEVPWHDLFAPETTFAIEVAGRSAALTHTHYAGLKVKDAIVDSFRARELPRPNVDTDNPGIRIHLHLERAQATLSLDIAGDSLHRRGYRRFGVEAPLKENLACAILIRSGWPELAAQGAPLFDPMCGSGTLLIEGAWMAADIAPGLMRQRWGFEGWLDHKPAMWQRLRQEAQARRIEGLARTPPQMSGRDLEPRAIAAARTNAERAGLADRIDWILADALDARPPVNQPGLIVTNPPYGERLGSDAELIKLYSLLGVTLKQYFPGWQLGFFTSRTEIAQRLGLRAEKMYSLYNGAIPCKLLRFDIPGARPALQPVAPVEAADTPLTDDDDPAPAPDSPWAKAKLAPAMQAVAGPLGGEEFANRLRKNLKHLGKWARRNDITNYRVYDADLPEYAIAVDLYVAEGELHAHIQEYAAPKTIEPARAERRLREALSQLQAVLDIPASRLHYKLRQSQKGTSQYTRQAENQRFLRTVEHGVQLEVNFEDYLDTGLFLDHRPLRLRIQREAAGKRVLNLFCYTASASAHAVVGGARHTVSVDMSNTYLEWAKRNLALNNCRAWDYEHPPAPGEALSPHSLIRADCVAWLNAEAEAKQAQQYDLIFLDPPTFSNSKKMAVTLDTQRDHIALITPCLKLLAPGGTLYFSTNRRGFKLDETALAGALIKDITAQTLDEDFKRPPPAHKCWQIQQSP